MQRAILLGRLPYIDGALADVVVESIATREYLDLLELDANPLGLYSLSADAYFDSLEVQVRGQSVLRGNHEVDAYAFYGCLWTVGAARWNAGVAWRDAYGQRSASEVGEIRRTLDEVDVRRRP